MGGSGGEAPRNFKNFKVLSEMMYKIYAFFVTFYRLFPHLFFAFAPLPNTLREKFLRGPNQAPKSK